jgi:hypothetical protein
MVKKIQRKRTGRIDGQTKRRQASTGIQTGRVQDKGHFEGE